MLRECKRCLTYEQADEKIRQNFMMLIDGIPKNERTSDRVYDERLTQCENCDSLLAGTCRACGCFVELRAAMKSSKCPHRLWDK